MASKEVSFVGFLLQQVDSPRGPRAVCREVVKHDDIAGARDGHRDLPTYARNIPLSIGPSNTVVAPSSAQPRKRPQGKREPETATSSSLNGWPVADRATPGITVRRPFEDFEELGDVV
jgi:hypothetical protein